jgi:hypothetical protein
MGECAECAFADTRLEGQVAEFDSSEEIVG